MAKRTSAQRLDAVRREKNIKLARVQAEAIALLDALQAAEPYVVAGVIHQGLEVEDILVLVHRAMAGARTTLPLLVAQRRREIEKRGVQIGEGEAR